MKVNKLPLIFTKKSSGLSLKEIETLIENREIKELGNGAYYKPKKSKFGDIPPNESEILRFVLHDEKGVRIGYVTGGRLYNFLGLTTQISSVITVAFNNPIDQEVRLGQTVIKYVKSHGDPEKDNHYLLQLLDVAGDIKTIPDSNVRRSREILSNKILMLPDVDRFKLLEISKKYPKNVNDYVTSLLLNR